MSIAPKIRPIDHSKARDSVPRFALLLDLAFRVVFIFTMWLGFKPDCQIL